jgi:Tfp pilus assembly protein PilF
MFDDDDAITRNPVISQLSPFAAFRGFPESPLAGRPLSHLSFAVNYALGGDNPLGYHAVNIVIHLACALLIFEILRHTLRSKGSALAIALLWAVHPLTTESVTYITERTESLMALCLLLTIYFGSIRGWTAAAIVACAAGMASKETMAVAPLIVMIYDRLFQFDAWRTALRQRWRMYVGLCVTWIVVAIDLAETRHAGSVAYSITWWTYLLNQSIMIVRYLRLAIWPSALVLNYGWTKPLGLGDVWPQAILVVMLLALTVAALRVRPRVGFAGVWFFLLLAPTSSVVPIATEVGAERRMYLPLVAVIAVMVLAVQRIAGLRGDRSRFTWIGPVAVGIAAFALGAATVHRNSEYASPLKMAQTVLARWPTSAAHVMVGAELVKVGRHDEAIHELQQAIPDDPMADFDLGVELFNMSRFDEAVPHLETFRREEPLMANVIPATLMIGHVRFQQQRWTDAATEFERVLTMAPGNGDARRALRLAEQGRSDQALAVFRRVVEIDPRDDRARQNLAAALLDADDVAGAIQQAQYGLQLNPSSPTGREMLAQALEAQARGKGAPK